MADFTNHTVVERLTDKGSVAVYTNIYRLVKLRLYAKLMYFYSLYKDMLRPTCDKSVVGGREGS